MIKQKYKLALQPPCQKLLFERNTWNSFERKFNSSFHGFKPVDLILQESQSEKFLLKSSDVALTPGNEGCVDVHISAVNDLHAN